MSQKRAQSPLAPAADAAGPLTFDADPPAEIELLHQHLLEKEQLIVALTDRLEQAAEQLDRLRRTGADRGGARRPGGSAIPVELLEDHRAAVEDLKQVITRWEEMQAGLTLGRIETQVTELRDLLAGYIESGPPHSSPKEAGDAQATGTKKPSPSAPSSWWETQKAAMLGDGPAPAGDAAATAVHAAARAAGESAKPIDLAELRLPELPPDVDFDNLTLDAACEAVRVRDRVLAQLQEPLLLAQAAGIIPPGATSLEHLPEPLRERLAAIESQWQAKYRRHELELSLERARLTRDEAALRQQQEQVRKELVRLGLDRDNAQDGDDDETDESNAVPRRRWFRFLGHHDDGAADE